MTRRLSENALPCKLFRITKNNAHNIKYMAVLKIEILRF